MAAARRRDALLSVGITTADWMQMGKELGRLEEAGADFVHIDVMDGVFCPQLTLGAPVIGALRTSLRKDVHLMIEEPLQKVAAYVEAGADVVTVHLEASRDVARVLQELGSLQTRSGGAVTRGIGLNPDTPVSAIEPLLDHAELVLVLAVSPGLRGQRFLPETERRLDATRELVARSRRKVVVGVDGGITRENVRAVAAMGPDVIVTGSAVFDGGDAAANLRAIRAAVSGAVAS